MSHAIRDRLMASVRIDAINGDGFERSVVRGQILEAISYIDAQAGQIATLKAALAKERIRDNYSCRGVCEMPGPKAIAPGEATMTDWKPYCFDEYHCKTYSEKDKIKPGHGPCCTCQDCGYPHDDCICQYLVEPCVSCRYKENKL